MAASRKQAPNMQRSLRLWWGIRSSDESAWRSQPCTRDEDSIHSGRTGTGASSPCEHHECSSHIKAAWNESAIKENSVGGSRIRCGRVRQKEGTWESSSENNRAQMRREREREKHTQRRLHSSAHAAARSVLALLMLSCVIVPACTQQSNNVVDAPKIISLVADDPDDLDGTDTKTKEQKNSLPSDVSSECCIHQSRVMLIMRAHTTTHTHEIAGVYANLDTITITFDKDTDQAGLAVGVVQTREVVDALFAFSQSLGNLVRAVSLNPSCARVTIHFSVSTLNFLALPGRC